MNPQSTTFKRVPTGNEQILLVDDEEAIAKVGQQILERLGYQLEARRSSIETSEAFRNHRDKFDLVITDMTMPQMTGEILAKELQQVRPDVPIVVCTGFSHRMDEEKARALGVRGFVMKPLVMGDVAESIRQVLDQQKETSKTIRRDIPSFRVPNATRKGDILWVASDLSVEKVCA